MSYSRCLIRTTLEALLWWCFWVKLLPQMSWRVTTVTVPPTTPSWPTPARPTPTSSWRVRCAPVTGPTVTPPQGPRPCVQRGRQLSWRRSWCWWGRCGAARWYERRCNTTSSCIHVYFFSPNVICGEQLPLSGKYASTWILKVISQQDTGWDGAAALVQLCPFPP